MDPRQYTPVSNTPICKNMSNDLLFRRAKLEDKQSVLDINDNIHDGRDYLPHFYDRIVSNHHAVLCQQHDGLIVAFMFVSVADGGETVVTRGGRIRPSYTGKKLIEYLFEFARGTFSLKAKRMAFTIIADGEYRVQKIRSLEKIGVKPVNYIVDSLYMGTLSGCKKRPIVQCDRIRCVDKVMLSTIFHSQSILDALFPDDVICINNVPYKPITSNIEQIVSESTLIVWSGDVETTRANSNISKGLLSVGTYYHSKAGLNYTIDIFGRNTSDFPSHLSEHLQMIQSFSNNGVIFYNVITPSHMDLAIVDKEMRQMGEFQRKWSTNVFYQKLTELNSKL